MPGATWDLVLAGNTAGPCDALKWRLNKIWDSQNRFILYYRRVVNTKPWDIPNFEPFAICGDSDTNYLGKNKKMCKTPVWLILVVVKSQSVFQSEPHVGKGLPSHQPTVVCYVSIRSSLAPSAQLVISFNYIQPQSISHGHPPWRLV